MEIVDVVLGEKMRFLRKLKIFPISLHFTTISEMYGSQIGKCPTTDKLLLEIRNRVDREVNNENPVLAIKYHFFFLWHFLTIGIVPFRFET